MIAQIYGKVLYLTNLKIIYTLMKYLMLFEELHVSKTVEKYANIIIKKLQPSDIKNGELLIHVIPEYDFPIETIKIVFTNSHSAFNSDKSDDKNIVLEINPNRLKLSLLIHELTHAYQFIKISSKGKKIDGFIGQFVGSAIGLSDNKDYQFLLLGLYLSMPTETDAHLAEYNYNNSTKIEKWLNWYKNYNPIELEKQISSIEDIEGIFPELFVEMYKEYCSENSYTPKRNILSLQGRSFIQFLYWCKKLFNKTSTKLERKLLRIKYSKTIS